MAAQHGDAAAATTAAAAFDDDELEDTDDSDMDEDDDVATGDQPPPPPTISIAGSIQFDNLIPNANPPSDPPTSPRNGAISVTPVSSSPAAAGGGTSGDHQTPSPDVKRQKIEERRPQPLASFDESRRLFQRLWTDDDEIKILRGFLEFTSSRGTTFASHQYDTGPFYEQIKNELQLDFNKSQLIEKLRRLKKKYRNTANRLANHGKDFTFKSPHERDTYEIARKIWSASIKKSRESDEDDMNLYTNPCANNITDGATSSDRKSSRSRRRGRKGAMENFPTAMPQMLALPPPPVAAVVGSTEDVVKVEVQAVPVATPVMAPPPIQKPSNSSAILTPTPPVPSIVGETVKSCLSPIFKELLNSAVSAPLGLGINLPPFLSFGGDMASLGNLLSDERWKNQQILELEVYLKRVELIRDQIKSTLEELKASRPSGS